MSKVILGLIAGLVFGALDVALMLRRLGDTPGKYQSIEQMPPLLEDIAQVKERVDYAIKEIDRMDPQKENRTATLLRLQSAKSDVEEIAAYTERIEEKMLTLLRRVREKAGA